LSGRGKEDLGKGLQKRQKVHARGESRIMGAGKKAGGHSNMGSQAERRERKRKGRQKGVKQVRKKRAWTDKVGIFHTCLGGVGTSRSNQRKGKGADGGVVKSLKIGQDGPQTGKGTAPERRRYGQKPKLKTRKPHKKNPQTGGQHVQAEYALSRMSS